MRKDLSHLDEFLELGGVDSVEDGGRWVIFEKSVVYMVIASWGMGWDHVSVSTWNRCPSWEEMCWVKEQFFEDEERVVQYHPPKSDYVNNHPFCLHLWRPQDCPVPSPPGFMV